MMIVLSFLKLGVIMREDFESCNKRPTPTLQRTSGRLRQCELYFY